MTSPHRPALHVIAALMTLWLCTPAVASDGAAVIAEGLVPDEATRMAIVKRLRTVYGDRRVVDRIEVDTVATPRNWPRYVAQAMTDDLKAVHGGELKIDGTAVSIRGRVADESTRDRVSRQTREAFDGTYDVRDDLTIDAPEARQELLDTALANRTVQFESGSSVLTLMGRTVLDDMAAAILRAGAPRIDVIGHTDSIGDRDANLLLSLQRAEAVKAYLAQRGIASSRMSISGRGPDVPVADNATSFGRSRNRRIEFLVVGR